LSKFGTSNSNILLFRNNSNKVTCYFLQKWKILTCSAALLNHQFSSTLKKINEKNKINNIGGGGVVM